MFTILKNRKWILRGLGVVLLVFLIFDLGQYALADVAPPVPPIGSDLYPSIENTNVRMLSEYVLLEIANQSENPSGHARVTASFIMQNLGEIEEQMLVRFPMNLREYDFEMEVHKNQEYCELTPLPALNNLYVWVNGFRVDVDITYETFLVPWAEVFGLDEYERTVPCWAHFWVTFPPGEEVTIEVVYTVAGYNFEGYGYQGYGGTKLRFEYVIGTGAGWKDTIGHADVVVRLPYEANEINVPSCIPLDCILSGNEVSWHFEDFEPEGNLSILVTRPEIWQRILQERRNLQFNPNDGESWGRLGMLYKQLLIDSKDRILYPDPQVFQLSVEAYQQAVRLLPEDADWHYGFSELYCKYAFWAFEDEAWPPCVEQLKFTLDLDQNHEAAKDMLEEIRMYQDWHEVEIIDFSHDPIDYLILTPRPTSTLTDTPLPTATRTSTAKPTLTQTVKPSATHSATPTASTTYTRTVEPSDNVAANMALENPDAQDEKTSLQPLGYLGVGLLLAILGVSAFLLTRKK